MQVFCCCCCFAWCLCLGLFYLFVWDFLSDLFQPYSKCLSKELEQHYVVQQYIYYFTDHNNLLIWFFHWQKIPVDPNPHVYWMLLFSPQILNWIKLLESEIIFQILLGAINVFQEDLHYIESWGETNVSFKYKWRFCICKFVKMDFNYMGEI